MFFLQKRFQLLVPMVSKLGATSRLLNAHIMKPQALFGHQEVKLIDFGVAQQEFGDKLSKYCGTQGYRAPEVGKSPYGMKCDVYSAGMTFDALLRRRFRWYVGETGGHKRVLHPDFRCRSDLEGSAPEIRTLLGCMRCPEADRKNASDLKHHEAWICLRGFLVFSTWIMSIIC